MDSSAVSVMMLCASVSSRLGTGECMVACRCATWCCTTSCTLTCARISRLQDAVVGETKKQTGNQNAGDKAKDAAGSAGDAAKDAGKTHRHILERIACRTPVSPFSLLLFMLLLIDVLFQPCLSQCCSLRRQHRAEEGWRDKGRHDQLDCCLLGLKQQHIAAA